jgi:hypothetical protein
MSWKNREGGHIVLSECDWSALKQLPKGVSVQVLRHENPTGVCYFIASRAIHDTKWPKGEYAFAEFSPCGAPAYIKKVREKARVFCTAFDAIYHAEPVQPINNPLPPGLSPMDAARLGFGPTQKIGELSLGLQMAFLLDTRVLSFIDDCDYDAEFACVNTPDGPERIHGVRLGVELLYEHGRVHAIRQPRAFSDAVDAIRGIEGVTLAKTRSESEGRLVVTEIDRFVGRSVANPDGIIPPEKTLTPVAERRGNGAIRLLS